MKSLNLRVCLVVLLIVSFGGVLGRAHSTAALKGNWVFSMQTAIGSFPADVSFKPNGRGSIDFFDSLPLVYREDGARFSTAVEVPAELSPNGQAMTIVFRGTKTSHTQVSGQMLFISDIPDPTNPFGFLEISGTFTGERR
jgi:hypothetical protein